MFHIFTQFTLVKGDFPTLADALVHATSIMDNYDHLYVTKIQPDGEMQCAYIVK